MNMFKKRNVASNNLHDSIDSICRSLSFTNLFHEIQFAFVKGHYVATYVLS